MSAIASKYFIRVRRYPTFLTYCLFSLMGAFLVFFYITHLVDSRWIIIGTLAPMIAAVCFYYPPVSVIFIFADFPLQQILGPNSQPQLLSIFIFTLMLFNVSFVSNWKTASYNKKIILFFIVFLFFVVQSEWWNTNATFSDYQSRYIAYGFFILVALQIKNMKDQKVILWSLTGLGTILSIWNIFQGSKPTHSMPVWTYAQDPNYTSCWIGIGIVFLCANLINFEKLTNFYKSLVLILLLINLYAITLLASRGVSIAIFLTIIVMLIHRFRNPLKMLTIVTCFIIIFSQIYTLPVFDTLRMRFENNTALDAGSRLPLALTAVDYLENTGIRELFLGGGTGSASYTMGHLEKSESGVENTHNTFLEFGMDYGIISLCILLALLTLLLRQNLLRASIVGQAFTGILIFIVICGFSLSPLRTIEGWIVLGIMLPKFSDTYS